MYGEGVRSSVHIENPWLFACCSADYIHMIGFLKKHLGILLWKVKVKQPLRRLTTQRTTRSTQHAVFSQDQPRCDWCCVVDQGPHHWEATEMQDWTTADWSTTATTTSASPRQPAETNPATGRESQPPVQARQPQRTARGDTAPVTHQGAMDRTSTRPKSFKWKLIII